MVSKSKATNLRVQGILAMLIIRERAFLENLNLTWTNTRRIIRRKLKKIRKQGLFSALTMLERKMAEM